MVFQLLPSSQKFWIIKTLWTEGVLQTPLRNFLNKPSTCTCVCARSQNHARYWKRIHTSYRERDYILCQMLLHCNNICAKMHILNVKRKCQGKPHMSTQWIQGDTNYTFRIYMFKEIHTWVENVCVQRNTPITLNS